MQDEEYVVRRLADMTREGLTAAQAAHTTHMSRGDSGNSRTHLFAQQAGNEAVRDAIERMARFTYEATQDHAANTASLLRNAARALADGYIGWLEEKRGKSPFKSVLPSLLSLKNDLSRMVAAAADDFEHGIVGERRLAQDPVINIVNTISNSPNAVVQNAIGEKNRQSAEQAALLKAILELLSSREFKDLPEHHQVALKDVAEVLQAEITKPDADESKVARWGRRLIEMANNVGLQVAAAGIASVLFA